MKIGSKSELKALIKECLIEILSDGVPSRPRLRDSVSEQRAPRASQLPATIPSSMKSLFSDSQRRAMDHMYQESNQQQKQVEVLGEMSDTWSNMAFGNPLPNRAGNPADHGGIQPPLPPGMGGFAQDDYDDGFDPYEAVRNAIPKRR
jgi:hypothetical protein